MHVHSERTHTYSHARTQYKHLVKWQRQLPQSQCRATVVILCVATAADICCCTMCVCVCVFVLRAMSWRMSRTVWLCMYGALMIAHSIHT